MFRTFTGAVAAGGAGDCKIQILSHLFSDAGILRLEGDKNLHVGGVVQDLLQGAHARKPGEGIIQRGAGP